MNDAYVITRMAWPVERNTPEFYSIVRAGETELAEWTTDLKRAERFQSPYRAVYIAEREGRGALVVSDVHAPAYLRLPR